jgi:hypothetical protein
MQASLPPELLEVFERSTTAEYVTIGRGGQPMARPVTPSFYASELCIEVAAKHDSEDPRVALLYSEATGASHAEPPMVLVQGTANLARERVRVRPERVLMWPGADLDAEPQLFDAHMEEVRSAHNAEPETGHAPPEGGPQAWDTRLEHLGTIERTAAVAFVGPDGFPFAVRVPVRADPGAGVLRIEADPLGAPIEPGLACLCARTLRVTGDLDEVHGSWVLRPHRVAG